IKPKPLVALNHLTVPVLINEPFPWQIFGNLGATAPRFLSRFLMGKFVKGAHACADNKSQSNKYRHSSSRLLLSQSQFLVFSEAHIQFQVVTRMEPQLMNGKKHTTPEPIPRQRISFWSAISESNLRNADQRTPPAQ
ncbi:hypothetical protein, partial [Mesorhizobium intechi]|uniref:hypothetical protein n=1 Tax=Mesorhizobium intechi TaxID=537601 RepID=UPI00319E05CC